MGDSVLCHIDCNDCRFNLTQQTADIPGKFSDLDGCSEPLCVCHISSVSYLLFLHVIVLLCIAKDKKYAAFGVQLNCEKMTLHISHPKMDGRFCPVTV